MNRYLILLLLLWLSWPAMAQKPFTRDFWLNEAGTAVKVNTLMRAPDGSLWAGSDLGLYRFNGRVFTSIPDPVHSPVTALGLAADGNIWIGHENGAIAQYNGNETSLFVLRNNTPASSITSLQEPQDGLLLAGTDDAGLYIITGRNCIQLNTANGLYDDYVYETAIAYDQKLLIATDQGINIACADGKKFSVARISTQNGLPDNIVRIMSRVPGTSQYWIGTQDNGVALYDHRAKTVHVPAMKTAWQWGQINGLIPENATAAWAGTENGYLLHLQIIADTLQVLPYDLEGKKIRKMIADPSGNLWCATNSGVTVISATYADQLFPGNGFDLKDLTAMECDADNRLWYAQGKTLMRLAQDGQPEPVHNTPAPVTCLYADDFGGMWIGTFGKGLFFSDRNKLTAVSIPALQDGHILDITGTKDRLWVASLNGVEELQLLPGGVLHYTRHHDKHAGIGSDYVYELYAGSKDRIWMATDGGGVCMYDGNKYHVWDTTSGMRAPVIYSVAEDGQNNIWAGTLDHGLYRYDGHQWTSMQRANGMQDMTVLAVAANQYGQVAAVDQRGINLWYPADQQFRHFNRRINMDIDSLSSVLNCIATDRNGNIYVPFDRGFIRFKAQPQPRHITPSINITTISLFLKPVTEPGKTRFSAAENYISFKFEGNNLASPERLFYRYKLEGYNNNWVTTADESVTYPQLPPGHYTFHVQASLSSDFYRPAETRYAFVIAAPVWKRAWFLVSMAIVIMGLGYLYLRFRERRLRKLSLLQRERMIFEYEHLKSQVNPHFLFNSLNTLVQLIDEDKDMAMHYTEQLSDLYRNMLAHRDQDLITLKEEWSLLEKYFYIQQNRFGQALQWELNIPPQLMPVKKLVPLALQLLVENAIKHNIVSSTMPLTIRIEADETTITVSNRYNPKQSKEAGAGLGLINIRKRYALLTRKTITYGIEGNEYIVTLPLL